MPIVSVRSKLLPPLAAALVILSQSAAWALGAQCIGCQMGQQTVSAAPVRPHVLASTLMAATVHPVTVRVPLRAAQPVYRAPTRLPSAGGQSSGFGIWDCIAHYESGGNWSDRSGGFEGGLQFLNSTWLAAGGGRYAQHAYDATPAQQVEIARSWLARTSWNQWPNTSRMCGVG